VAGPTVTAASNAGWVTPPDRVAPESPRTLPALVNSPATGCFAARSTIPAAAVRADALAFALHTSLDPSSAAPAAAGVPPTARKAPVTSDAGLNVERILGVLRRRATVIVLCVVLVGAAALVYSKGQTKMYTAKAALLFGSSAISQQVAGLSNGGSGIQQQSQQDTNVQLVQLGDMSARTAAALGHGLTEGSVTGAITVAAIGDTNVVTVSAVSTSPTLAADIANTYTTEFVTEQQNQDQAYYKHALFLVEQQIAKLSPTDKTSTVGLALQTRAQSLGTLSELKSGTVEVAQAAKVPAAPSSPRPFRSTVLACLLGLLIGLGAAFLLERADRLIREPNDLAELYGLPLLGAVPESPELSRSIQRSSESGGILPSGEAEVFHLLRAHLRYFNVDRELRTLLVVSAAAGDGKTTVACHLAGAAARLGSRVLLVEADVRRPTISAQLQLDPSPGLSEVLIGAVTMREAIQPVDLDSPVRTGRDDRTLDVLAAGAAVPPNPAELIESHAMEALLAEAKASYELVIIDTPPLTAVSDAFPLLRKVDGVIVVGRVGRDRRDVAKRTSETLNSVGAALLGVIANGVKRSAQGSSYGYSYSYSSSERTGPSRREEAASLPARPPRSKV
jgi:capsular exopolysaccharide synthesis family protein